MPRNVTFSQSTQGEIKSYPVANYNAILCLLPIDIGSTGMTAEERLHFENARRHETLTENKHNQRPDSHMPEGDNARDDQEVIIHREGTPSPTS